LGDKKMKREILALTLTLVMVISLFSAPAKAASGGISYTNGNLGFSLTIPASWAGKYRVADFSTAANFISIGNEAAGCGGFLFGVLVSGSMEPLDWNGYRLLGQSGGLYYFGGVPSDVQFDYTNKSLADEYQSMEKDVEAIFKSFRITTDNLTIQLDGKNVATDVAPYIDANSRTMVPVRFISEALGAEVGWDANSQTVTVTKGPTVIKLTIGSRQIITNGIATTMDTAAIVKDGRTFVPVRYIAEALGLTVSWDGATKTVFLTTSGVASTPTPTIPQTPPTSPPAPPTAAPL
jgi:hypothetical protein